MSKDKQLIFNAYDEEFKGLTGSITTKLEELKESNSNPKGPSVVEALLSQANELIKQMDIEVRGEQNLKVRKELTDKLSKYKKELGGYKAEYEKVKESINRSNLIGDKSIEQRQRLLDTNEKLSRQNEMIMNAQRTVAETEEVGLEITSELARNREKIQSAHGKVKDFSSITDSARRLVSSMSRRDVQQRFILFFIAAVLIIAIVITVYFMNSGGK